MTPSWRATFAALAAATLIAGPAAAQVGAPLIKQKNLSDVASPSAALANIGGVSNAAQAPHAVLVGPATGSSPAGPTYRSLVGLDLPFPSAASLGGVESIAAVSHDWIAYIDVTGLPHLLQPGFSDLSGSASCGQLPAQTGDVTTVGCVATLPATGAAAQTTLSGAVTAKGLHTSTFAAPVSAPLLGTTSGAAPQAVTLGSGLSIASNMLTLAPTSAQILAGLGYTPATLGSAGNTYGGPQTINENAAGASAYSPGGLFNIIGPDGSSPSVYGVGFGAGAGCLGYRADGTGAAPTALVAGDLLTNCGSGGYDGATWSLSSMWTVFALDTWTSTDHSTCYRANTTPPNSTTNMSTMVACAFGVGIGPGTFSYTGPPNAVLDVESTATTTTSSDTVTLGSSSATGTIVTGTLPNTWPKRGTLQVDNELMSYTWTSTTGLQITARGVFGSTGATHSCGSSCTIDFALEIVAKNTSALPDLIVMSNGAIGVGALPPVPTAAAGTENAAARQSGGVAGVSCSGTPTSSFASTGGLVTHC